MALKVALSDKARHGHLLVVDDFAVSSFSTKHVVKTLKALKVEKALLADERKDNFLYLSTRNIYGSDAVCTADLNADAVVRHHALVISETALKILSQRFEEK